jgi:hypothetical protein
MGKTRSGIIAIIRQKLHDEPTSGQEPTWENDELAMKIDDVLAEISEASPRIVIETLQTSAASRELDISSIEDLVNGGESILKAEWPVGYWPKNDRNVEVVGDTLTMVTNLLPSAGEDVYLTCAKVHQLTKSGSTLSRKLERLLVLGVCGYVTLDRAGWWIGKIVVGGWRSPAQAQSWGAAQLSLYREGLNEITEPRTYEDLPLS